METAGRQETSDTETRITKTIIIPANTSLDLTGLTDTEHTQPYTVKKDPKSEREQG